MTQNYTKVHTYTQ